jgi:putative FmdB family regulatory protein
MPVYDYQCASCGPFSAFRSMADYAKPAPCDTCGVDAPRAILSAPALANMDPSLRKGHATNERSRHEPRRSGGSHPAGCGCCGPRKPSAAAGAAKSFPGARPWMISH